MSSNTASGSFFINRDFALYWCIRICSMVAFQMIAVAVGWHIYDITRSALALGYVGLAGFLPAVFLVLVTGQVADRFDRRRVVQSSHTLEGLVALTLALGSWQGWISETVIFVAVFFFGVGKAFSGPTLAALLPSLVSKDELPRAVSTASAAMQTAIIIGPATGGLLYAFGATTVYAAATALFLLAILLLGLIRRPVHAEAMATASPEDRSIFAGIRFIRAKPVVLGAISLDLFAVLLGGATALLPIFAKDILHTTPFGLGVLRSAPAAGALLMSFWLARRPIMRRAGRVMFGGVAVFGVATVVFGLSHNYWISLLALATLGAADMISVVIRSSLIQLETPDAMRGRVSAVNFLFIGASNQLGEFESGVTAAWLGAVPAVVVGGLGTLAVVGLWMWWFPQLARRDRLVEKTAD